MLVTKLSRTITQHIPSQPSSPWGPPRCQSQSRRRLGLLGLLLVVLLGLLLIVLLGLLLSRLLVLALTARGAGVHLLVAVRLGLGAARGRSLLLLALGLLLLGSEVLSNLLALGLGSRCLGDTRILNLVQGLLGTLGSLGSNLSLRHFELENKLR
ncbi:hypothetical protein ASPWEDRAFT_557445 [Aspergillus wentii DTO 134E9]|uniref:Uncharacterized protein n=1 Tax=Aspergillus wentii DTO 134E9 TaxID=1073089 RepID=A0A1L9RGL0_ASPWE|nr:uncharacterized protein ASPWEDRAFT_557445 [Aspergillus wentii DTO 134E9]OJJ34061.1 hypothetical protein ASPWEDRAFT_557445 [Aspergillus wentii DTO 134E9]